MQSSETAASLATMQNRIEAANAWITTCYALASSPIFKVVGENFIAVHSATTGQSLFSVDWSRVMLVVEIAEGTRVYLFHDMNGALTFLNGVLLNYVVDRSEPQSTASSYFSRGRF